MHNNIESQYLDLLKELYQKSNEPIRTDRTGTGTFSVFGRQLRHSMREGFPLLTTKRMAFSQIKSELIWFMLGRTDLKYLLDRKNYIWVGDAYKAYLKYIKRYQDVENCQDYMKINDKSTGFVELTKFEFIEKIKSDMQFSDKFGDLGPIYGKQWRRLDNHATVNLTSLSEFSTIDQLSKMIQTLKTSPYSRRNIVSSWNVEEIDQMTLPPCHLLYQVYVEDMSNVEKHLYPGFEKKISLQWYQRSVDTFLGLPFNIASYGLLLEILGKLTGYLSWELIVSTGDTHIYSDHVEAVKLQIERDQFDLPTIKFSEQLDFSSLDKFLNSYQALDETKENQILLNDYLCHSAITANLSN